MDCGIKFMILGLQPFLWKNLSKIFPENNIQGTLVRLGERRAHCSKMTEDTTKYQSNKYQNTNEICFNPF